MCFYSMHYQVLLWRNVILQDCYLKFCTRCLGFSEFLHVLLSHQDFEPSGCFLKSRCRSMKTGKWIYYMSFLMIVTNLRRVMDVLCCALPLSWILMWEMMISSEKIWSLHFDVEYSNANSLPAFWVCCPWTLKSPLAETNSCVSVLENTDQHFRGLSDCTV